MATALAVTGCPTSVPFEGLLDQCVLKPIFSDDKYFHGIYILLCWRHWVYICQHHNRCHRTCKHAKFHHKISIFDVSDTTSRVHGWSRRITFWSSLRRMEGSQKTYWSWLWSGTASAPLSLSSILLLSSHFRGRIMRSRLSSSKMLNQGLTWSVMTTRSSAPLPLPPLGIPHELVATSL